MSRSWDQFHHTRGADDGGEYDRKRLGQRGWLDAGPARFGKTLTHRAERRIAKDVIQQEVRELHHVEPVSTDTIVDFIVAQTVHASMDEGFQLSQMRHYWSDSTR